MSPNEMFSFSLLDFFFFLMFHSNILLDYFKINFQKVLDDFRTSFWWLDYLNGKKKKKK